MKKPLSPISYVLVFLLMIMFFSCKKPSALRDCGCIVLPHPILFEIVDKSGNSIIRSVNDTLQVTYILDNGVTVTNRLDIFKSQVSATNTAQVANYNGFVISDSNPTVPGAQGYMSSLPVGVNDVQSQAVHNFKFYLNGALIGSVYFDYSGLAASNSAFTLNGTPATAGNIPGFLTFGYPAQGDLYIPANPLTLNSFVYVLQYN